MSETDSPKPPPKTPAWEPIAIILCVLALLPQIYFRDELFADILMYTAGVLMFIVLVRKIRRLQALWRHQNKRNE